jgi:hypothetical protein
MLLLDIAISLTIGLVWSLFYIGSICLYVFKSTETDEK